MDRKAVTLIVGLALLLIPGPLTAEPARVDMRAPLEDQLALMQTLHQRLPQYLEGLNRRNAQKLSETVRTLKTNLAQAPDSGVDRADFLLSEYLDQISEYRKGLHDLMESHERDVNDFLDDLDREVPNRAEDREERRRILLFEGGTETRRAADLLELMDRHAERFRSLVLTTIRYSLLDREHDRLRILLDQLDQTLPTLVQEASANTLALDTVIQQYLWYLRRSARELSEVQRDRATLRARYEGIVKGHGSFLARLPNSQSRNRPAFESLLSDLNERASELSGEKYKYLNPKS